MPWRYGIVNFKKGNFRYYGVGEIYYNEDPLKPFACSEQPVDLSEEVEPDQNILGCFKKTLQRILNDIEQYPVFDIDGPFEPAPWESEKELTLEQISNMTDEEIELELKE